MNENGEFLCSWETPVNGSKFCPLDITRYNDETVAMTIEGFATIWKFPDVESMIIIKNLYKTKLYDVIKTRT